MNYKQYTKLPIKQRLYVRLIGNLVSFVLGVVVFMAISYLVYLSRL